MSALSSTPRGECPGRPGITWQTAIVRTEQHIDDDQPDPAPPNRATRRAMKRAARRTK